MFHRMFIGFALNDKDEKKIMHGCNGIEDIDKKDKKISILMMTVKNIA
jgi:hypothetical protein